MPSVVISGIGHYVPPHILTNADLESRLDTTDAWIREHTGIVTRHYAQTGGTSDIAVPALVSCLARAGISIDEVDCLIVATSTPDYAFPSTAAVVLRKMSAARTWGFDVSAACSGFLYALAIASSLIRSATCRRVLVCGAERLTAITDYEDRLTAVLFGDAAAAILIEASEESDIGVIDAECRLAPVPEEMLYQPAGGSAHPATAETVRSRGHYLRLHGREVFRAAVESMVDVTNSIATRNAIRVSDVDWIVPHQANLRIVREVAMKLGASMDKVMINVDRYGNTSAASIPLCLSEWYENGRLLVGARLILTSFGAGFTAAGAYIRWSLPPT